MEQILRLLRAKNIEWLSSAALEAETSRNPDPERRDEVQVLLLLATNTIPLDGQIIQRARELEAAGYGAFDALHLSRADMPFWEIDLCHLDNAPATAAQWRLVCSVGPQPAIPTTDADFRCFQAHGGPRGR